MIKYLLLIILAGCSFLVGLDDQSLSILGSGKKENQLILAFSHNVNGETHPCGCRQFPLGGLPQLAGQLNDLKNKGQLIYLDTGDLFFPTASTITSVEKSLTFTAHELLDTYQKLGINFLLPGDQDFALGTSFLQEVGKKIPYLVTNLIDDGEDKPFMHRHWGKIEWQDSTIFFLGIVHPEVMGKNASYFTSIDEGMKKGLKLLSANGYDPNKQNHRLIVLSHSGTQNDEELAKNYPQIDWIIGAHDMRFTQEPIQIGTTKIVQTLSRNHYLGTIVIDGRSPKASDKFAMHEIREERAALLNPNPWIKYLDNYKIRLEKIQAEEQKLLSSKLDNSTKFPLSTAASCISCHKEQHNFWQKTGHALAYPTLATAKGQHNTQCIGCHSLGFKNPQGFQSTQDVVRFESQNKDLEEIKEDDLEKIRHEYWEKSFKIFPQTSIRKMSSKERFAHSERWINLDDKFIFKNIKVSHNFANVQCLNCHDQKGDHPFGEKSTLSRDSRIDGIKNRCLACHTSDQSPELYQKEKLKNTEFDALVKKMSCPKIK